MTNEKKGLATASEFVARPTRFEREASRSLRVESVPLSSLLRAAVRNTSRSELFVDP